jgi:hypothetical protein
MGMKIKLYGISYLGTRWRYVVRFIFDHLLSPGKKSHRREWE